MQSGTSARTAATTPTPSAGAPTPLVVAPQDLLAAFATVPDPRRRQGTRFALPAVLALTVAAMLSSHLSVLAVAEWGAHQC
ncbi:MAG: transposase family protein [Chloroflexi bacterium]|nr:transposase family protein [Chloroflexota bacterium]